jgi:hypothetical protein
MKARIGIFVAIVAIGAWTLARLVRPHPPPARVAAAQPGVLECHLRVGEELAFRLRGVTDSTTGAATQHLELGAVLHWRVLATRGTGWRVAAVLDQVTLDRRPDAPAPELVAGLAAPFRIDLGRDCRFEEIAFSPSSEARVASQLEALVRSMEIVLPVAPVRQWSVRQEDALGSYQGHYRLEAGGAPAGSTGPVISRRRLRYLAFRVPAPVPKVGGPTAEILSSQARATLDGGGRWLVALSSQDHIKISLGERLLVELTGSLQFQRIDGAPLPRLAGLRTDGLTDGFVGRSALEAGGGSPEPKGLNDALAALDLKGALADFERRLGSGRGGLHDGVATLAGYLLRRPGAIAELMKGLRDGSIDPRLHSAIFLALERTGSPQAERALTEGVVDGRLGGVDRMRAAAALADVPHPSRQVVEALVAGTRSGAASGTEAEEVSRSALLALGSLDHNTATSDPELAGRARDALGARLRAGPPPEELVADLDAAGNAGDPLLLPALERYTEDPSPLVRLHAAGAYRRAEGDADEARLTAWLRGEPDPRVRRAIVASLAERVEAAGGWLSSDLLATAIALLPQEPDAQVRGLLIQLLGGVAASVPEAKQALIDQFHREQRPELLELIGHYCSTDELG